MKSWTVTRYVLIGLFAVATLGATAYEWWYVWPVEKCEQARAWWDPKDHQCLTPIPLYRFTGHLPAAAAPKS